MTVQNHELSSYLYRTKYLQRGETFEEGMTRVANALKDNDYHFREFRDILLDKRFLPGGRVQAAVGAARVTTPYNCFVSGSIPDSMEGICGKLGEAIETMRRGGGIGYDFSTIRPRGARISTLDSSASGPISFMGLFDAGCATVLSAGHRRGAQMGVLRVDHPDIEEFILAKRDNHTLTNFNVSVGVTDSFMAKVTGFDPDPNFPLVFNGQYYKIANAKHLWEMIMRGTWDWAEPGILFIDKINRKNNLWYCENIAATNPCAEQPLPPYGACLLGSFNLTRYLITDVQTGVSEFQMDKFKHDIPAVVRAMDNIVDRAIYPLPQQAEEARNKRRMGLGVTGLANVAEILGYPYGSAEMLKFTKEVLTVLRDSTYLSSVELAAEKGSFPLLYRDRYLHGNEYSFAYHLPNEIKEAIATHGIRNSHLLSIAPTGTISLCAGNVSSGIEPPYTSGEYIRNVYDEQGDTRKFLLQDYAEYNYNVVGKTADEVNVQDHVNVLTTASNLVDSAVSKTCNVGDNVNWEAFQDVYIQAWINGASGCTTFRKSGRRFSIFSGVDDVRSTSEPTTCYIDPETGSRSCE